jgi:hypothetical protein
MSRALVTLLIVLCGCASVEEYALRNVPDGPSRSWRTGYADGCFSARRDSRGRQEHERDAERYRADDLYRDGWDAGYRDCLARAEATPTPTPVPAEVAVETPLPTATPAPAAAPTPARAATPSSAARRAEIEQRIGALRGELEALEAELEALPK